MKQRLLIALLLPLLVACSTPTTSDPLEAQEAIAAPIEQPVPGPTVVEVVVPAEIELEEEEETYATSQNALRLNFDDFELFIDSLEVWEEEEKLEGQQTDTVLVYVELGDTPEGATIIVNQRREGTLNIFQSFENSVTVMAEGPHCDLSEWKHYNTEWEQLTNNNGRFLMNTLTDEDTEKFIETDMLELGEAVRNQCGDEWAKHALTAESPNDYPCGVGTSRIFLKLEFTAKGTDKPVEQMVSFELPMGC